MKGLSLGGLRNLVALTLTAVTISAQAVGVTDATGQTVDVKDASRIVAVGGSLTETIYALGEENRLVGVDTTSLWPEAATKLPQVGYQRTLAAEGILSLKPTLVLGTMQAGPPEVLSKLRAAGVTVLLLNNGPDADHAITAMETVAKVLGKAPQGAALVGKIRTQLTADAATTASAKKPRVLFLMSANGGVALGAGTNTHADSMIQLAGGENVVQSFEGYKPISPESALLLAPEVLLVPTHVVQALGGKEKLLKLPGISQTPAVLSDRVVVMDALLLLGMGPRLADAVQALRQQLHRAPVQNSQAAPSQGD